MVQVKICVYTASRKFVPGIHHFTTREPAVAYATGSR